MKIICIGLNYADHTKELSNQIPEKPVFFIKPDGALLRNNNPFFIPDFSEEIHYEVEIIFKIKHIAKCVKPEFVHRYFDEIGIGIDFTARDLQRQCMQKGLPWEIAKAFDNSAAISNFISKDEFPDLENINFRLDINGITVQKGCTAHMLFNFETMVSYVSNIITLKMGDIFFTGTPSGVGPVKIGDRLQAYIEDQLMMDFMIR
jgi:acylpyruvate hydrolase